MELNQIEMQDWLKICPTSPPDTKSKSLDGLSQNVIICNYPLQNQTWILFRLPQDTSRHLQFWTPEDQSPIPLRVRHWTKDKKITSISVSSTNCYIIVIQPIKPDIPLKQRKILWCQSTACAWAWIEPCVFLGRRQLWLNPPRCRVDVVDASNHWKRATRAERRKVWRPGRKRRVTTWFGLSWNKLRISMAK